MFYADIIYLDYRKAFDTIPQCHLQEKMKDLGIFLKNDEYCKIRFNRLNYESKDK